MQTELESLRNSIKYSSDFPKLKRFMTLSDEKIYRYLVAVPTSNYYRWDIDEVKKAVKRDQAYR